MPESTCLVYAWLAVIPAKAGIHLSGVCPCPAMDSGFRRYDIADVLQVASADPAGSLTLCRKPTREAVTSVPSVLPATPSGGLCPKAAASAALPPKPRAD